MNLTFKELDSDQKLFFDMLPDDWQDEIVPHWNDYSESSRIYIIEEADVLIGGGIVFSKCPPDVDYYKNETQKWFDNDYLYLGFIWIAEDKRNKNLGSYWIDELKKRHPEQKYWLLIEEEHLHRFYRKNGFVVYKMISNEYNPEWLYVFEPHSS